MKKRKLFEAFRAHKAHAAAKGWRITRRQLKARARRFPDFARF